MKIPGPKLVDLEEEDKEGKPDQEEDEIAAAHRAVLQDAVKESYAEPYRVKSVKELSAAEKGIGFQGFEAQTKHLTAEQLEKWTNEAARVPFTRLLGSFWPSSMKRDGWMRGIHQAPGQQRGHLLSLRLLQQGLGRVLLKRHNAEGRHGLLAQAEGCVYVGHY